MDDNDYLSITTNSGVSSASQHDPPELVAEEGQGMVGGEHLRAQQPDLTTSRHSQAAPFLASTFVYPTLDDPTKQVRLVRFDLVAQPDTAPIRCTLSASSLEEASKTSYNVLSYCWGTASLFKPIYVNGQLHHITTNLEAALRSVMNSYHDVQVWADALCINQADIVEKAFQVDMMASIFSNAALCIIWLGNTSAKVSSDPNVIHEPDAIKAFALLESLARNEHYTRPGNNEEGSLGPLMKLQWWHRIWTVQEAVLPSNCIVRCGQLTISWTSVIEASTNFRNHLYTMCCNRAVGSLKEFHRKIAEIEVTRRESVSAEGMNMVRSLQGFQDRGSWDSRDKVYGLLALGARQQTGVTVAAGLKADYSRKCQDVFLDTAWRLTEHTKNLDILLRTREYNRLPDLPSWVPDWRATLDRHRGRELLRWHAWALHSACGGLGTNFGVTGTLSAPRILQLSGVKVDDIAVVGNACQDPRAFSIPPEGAIVMNFPDRLWWRLTEETCGSNATYPVGSIGYSEAFMRVLALNCLEDSYDANSGIVYRRIAPEDVATCMREVRSSKQHSTYFKSKMINRRFFITKSGLIGTGPVDISIGDSIFVLFGANFPLVLRKPPSLPQDLRAEPRRHYFYNFVGDTYVHGVMDGEYAQKAQEEMVCLI